jgi:predicted nucleic acid-binding protein
VGVLVEQEATEKMTAMLHKNASAWVWWGTKVEAMSALCRLERAGYLTAEAFALSVTKWEQLHSNWSEVEPAAAVKEIAIRLLRVHPLRTADALQLAAATIAAEHRPSTLEFVCLDKRLAEAASKEGFPVIGSASA